MGISLQLHLTFKNFVVAFLSIDHFIVFLFVLITFELILDGFLRFLDKSKMAGKQPIKNSSVWLRALFLMKITQELV